VVAVKVAVDSIPPRSLSDLTRMAMAN